MTAKPKKELMRENRKRRKELSLVEFRAWCTEKEREEHRALAKQHEKVKPTNKPINTEG